MQHYRTPPAGFGFGMLPPMGRITQRLLIANIVIFLVHMLLFRSSSRPDPVIRVFALSLYGLRHGMLWQLVTYMFLHGGLWHLVGNMFGLFFFGRELEMHLGSRRFLLLYFGCGVLGALGWLLLGSLGLYTLDIPMIGASGAVFGIVGAYAALFPYRQVTLLLFFVIPVTMTARTMALVFGGLSLLLLGDGSSIAHAAHLGGGIAGYVYGLRLVRGQAGYGAPPLSGIWRELRPRDWLARLRRSRFRVDGPCTDGPVDWERVDRILVKIKTEGFGALSPEERAELERASRAAERQRR
jgi:membrane associated rhomboid family serine protease